jgi:hypothetical protein
MKIVIQWLVSCWNEGEAVFRRLTAINESSKECDCYVTRDIYS